MDSLPSLPPTSPIKDIDHDDKHDKAKAYEASRRHYNRPFSSSNRTFWTSKRINGAKRRIGKVLIDRFGKVDGEVDDLAASQMPCNPKGYKPHFKQYLSHPRKPEDRDKCGKKTAYGLSYRYTHSYAKPKTMSTKDALGSLGPLLASLDHLAIYKIRTLKAFDTQRWYNPIAINMAVDPTHYDQVMRLRKHKETQDTPLYPIPIEDLRGSLGTSEKSNKGNYVIYLGNGHFHTRRFGFGARVETLKSGSITPLLAIHFHLIPQDSKRYYVGSVSGLVLKVFGWQRRQMMEDLLMQVSKEDTKDGKEDVHYGGKKTDGVASVVDDDEPVGYHTGRIFMREEGTLVREWM